MRRMFYFPLIRGGLSSRHPPDIHPTFLSRSKHTECLIFPALNCALCVLISEIAMELDTHKAHMNHVVVVLT